MAKRPINTQSTRILSLLSSAGPKSALHRARESWEQRAVLLCKCRDVLEILDCQGDSATFACWRCGACHLHIQHPEFGCLLVLRGFLQRRGDGPQQRPLADLGMATRLVDSLIRDCWPSAATIVDYGIDSPSHLGALQYAVHCGVTAYDLDCVMGDGQAITGLVRAVPDQPYRHVEFRTAYDGLAEEEEEDEDDSF